MPRCNAETLKTLSKPKLFYPGQRWLLPVMACLFFCIISHSTFAQKPQVDFSGDTKIVATDKKVTGDATGSALASARTGKDFHILVKGLPNEGPLQLELGFADLEKTETGERLFDLTVNDKSALRNFDIVKEAGGPLKSVIKRFTITPTDGTLDFHFMGIAGDAAVNYIRISGEGVNLLLSSPTNKTNALALTDDDDYVPADAKATFNVEDGTIDIDSTSETWNSGVPIGGIGTGKFELLPNGQFGNMTINNSWDLPVLRPRGTFLAIAAKTTSGRGGGRLLQVNPADVRGNKIFGEDYPAMSEGKFTGKFPFGRLDLRDEKFPLKVTVEGWSPLIPYDVEASALPAGVINVLVENPQKYPVSTAVAFSWEDINGRGGSLLPGDQHGYSSPSVHKDAATSEVTGFQITSTHTLNDREATFTGDLFLGTSIEGTAITRSLAWNPRSETIPWWRNFTRRLRLDKIPTSPASESGKGAGPMASTLCVSFNLAPKEIRRVPFIVAWYAPKIVTLDSASGTPSHEEPDYAHKFGSSVGVASHLASHRKDFREKTDEWVDMIERATIPQWAKIHSLNSLFPMHSNSILLKNSRFAMLESPADMKGMLGPVDLKLGSDDFLLTMFPSLQKTELNLYARAQDASGRIPRYVGNIHGALSGFDIDLLGNEWYDPTASWILEVARYWRETGDDATLSALSPNLTKAQTYLAKELGPQGTASDGNVFTELADYTAAGTMSRLKAFTALSVSQQLLDSTPDSISQLIESEKAKINLNPTTATFAAMLAGEYAARAAASPGILSTSDVNTYLAKIRAQNFVPSKPVPLMESGGTQRNAVSALAPLQAYVGGLGLSTGQPDAGVEPYLRMFQVAYAAQKAPWKQALLYDAPAGAKPQMRYHRASMAAWSLWRGLSGVVYDQPNQRLYINPQPVTTASLDMELPVFTTSFWGWLKFNAEASTGTLAVTRVTGETTPTLRAIASGINVNDAPKNLVQFPTPLLLEEGASIEFDGWPRNAGGTASAIPPPPPPVVEEKLTTGTLGLDDGATTGSQTESDDGETTRVPQSSPETAEGEEMDATDDSGEDDNAASDTDADNEDEESDSE